MHHTQTNAGTHVSLSALPWIKCAIGCLHHGRRSTWDLSWQLTRCLVQDTVRVEIDLGDSGLSYQPGDALGVYAQNSAEVQPCPTIPAPPQLILCYPALPCSEKGCMQEGNRPRAPVTTLPRQGQAKQACLAYPISCSDPPLTASAVHCPGTA